MSEEEATRACGEVGGGGGGEGLSGNYLVECGSFVVFPKTKKKNGKKWRGTLRTWVNILSP